MNSKFLSPRLVVPILMILLAAAIRLIPHPSNLTPITAMALFGGAFLPNKRSAFIVPIVAMLLSDLVIGFHTLLPVVYGCFLISVAMGLWVQKKRSVGRIAVTSLASSLLFFVVTNFAVWAFQEMYPKTLAGLAACYVAALPFFQQTILGDALFTAVLFGGYALVQKWLPVLRETAVTETV